MFTWVLISKFCEISGYTDDAVRAKRKRGVWIDGVHIKKAPDGRIFVNVEAVRAWIERKE